MSVDPKFRCEFCKKAIESGSINTEHMAVTKVNQAWTNNLFANFKGPHICMTCVEAITKVKSSFKVVVD